MVELEHQLHHAQLLVQGHIGVDGVVGVLLKKAHPEELGGLDDELLILGQDVRADELCDLH